MRCIARHALNALTLLSLLLCVSAATAWTWSYRTAACATAATAATGEPRFAAVVSNCGTVELGVSGAWPRGGRWSMWTEPAGGVVPAVWAVERTNPDLMIPRPIFFDRLGISYEADYGSMGLICTPQVPIADVEQRFIRVRVAWAWPVVITAILLAWQAVGSWRRRRVTRRAGFPIEPTVRP